MAKDDELKKSIKELVKEIVSDTASKLVKASATKTVTSLRDQLKEEAIKRAEAKLKKTAKELHKDFSSEAKDTEYVSKFNQAFEEKFQKLLTSLSKGALQTVIIASVCTLIIGGFLGWIIVERFIEPPPRADLVITEITFQMEALYTEEPLPEIGLPGEIRTIFETFEELCECLTSYQLTVHYVIENQGEKKTEPSTSYLYLCGKVIAEDPVDSLAVGETSEESFPYYPFLRDVFHHYFCYAYADIEIEVEADCDQSVKESNEENNSLTLRFNQPR